MAVVKRHMHLDIVDQGSQAGKTGKTGEGCFSF